MKKFNLVFVGECVIIVLLLLVLGILLKDNTKNILGRDTTLEEVVRQETTDTEEALLEKSVEETTASGIVSVSDYVNASKEEILEKDTVTLSSNQPEKVKKFVGKKMVVFGDSIWNAGRGVDGISEHIQEETGATVYNCAIGGTTAALTVEQESMENWKSNSFNGMIYVARKLVPAEQVLGEDVVCDIIKQVDFNEMDYVIVAYGLNDFFSDVPIFPTEYYEMTNYVGALRNGIAKLKENYPHLKIIVVSPTYTKLFEGEKEFEIGNYVEAARSVAQEMDVEFLDMFHILGNDAESRTEHLGDGVHLSSAGRKVYADAVIWFLNGLEETAEE